MLLQRRELTPPRGHVAVRTEVDLALVVRRGGGERLDELLDDGPTTGPAAVASGERRHELGQCRGHQPIEQGRAIEVVANGSGVARFDLPSPPAAGLVGATAFVQGAVLDPLGPLSGLAFSAARQLMIGD